MEQFPLRMSNWLFKVMEELVIKSLSYTPLFHGDKFNSYHTCFA